MNGKGAFSAGCAEKKTYEIVLACGVRWQSSWSSSSDPAQISTHRDIYIYTRILLYTLSICRINFGSLSYFVYNRRVNHDRYMHTHNHLSRNWHELPVIVFFVVFDGSSIYLRSTYLHSVVEMSPHVYMRRKKGSEQKRERERESEWMIYIQSDWKPAMITNCHRHRDTCLLSISLYCFLCLILRNDE